MSDFDGDLVMTTDQKEFVEMCKGGVPVAYSPSKVKKCKINEKELHKADLLSFNSKIGFITNCSTTMYAMRVAYDKESPEYKEMTQRIALCRKEQGLQIDKAKGLIVKPFPHHWTHWTDGMDFWNSILVDKRPYFMRYLYSGYNKELRNFSRNYDTYALATFGEGIDDLKLSPDTPEKKEVLSKFNRFSPLLDTDCVMNRICHHMEKEAKGIKKSIKPTPESVVRMMKDTELEIDVDKLKQLYDIYKFYKSSKKNFSGISDDGIRNFGSINQYNRYILQKCYAVSSSVRELATLAVIICYEMHPKDNKKFAWHILGEGIVLNVEANRVKNPQAPFRDEESGDVEFLGSRYKMMEINIGEDITEGYDYL